MLSYIKVNDERQIELTQDYVQNRMGINLHTRLVERGFDNPEIVIDRLLRKVSNHIYNYIFQFNINNNYQRELVLTFESAQKIVCDAMEEQLEYFLSVGDVQKSTDKEKRKLGMDEEAKEILNRPIPELGFSLLYMGL